jgi:hypothetical protein
MRVRIFTSRSPLECSLCLDANSDVWPYSKAPLVGGVSDDGFLLALSKDLRALGFAAAFAKGRYVERDAGTEIEITRGRLLVHSVVGYLMCAVGISAFIVSVLIAIAKGSVHAFPGPAWVFMVPFPLFGYLLLHCAEWLSTKRDWDRLVDQIACAVEGQILREGQTPN